MKTVQVVLDENLLRATDLAARRMHQSRSSLVRDALREHLLTLAARELEERDRSGYAKHSPAKGESSAWEAEAEWSA